MKTVAIYNLKGGVGKTTTTVNLGWSAARSGLRTLIWDVDPQAASTFYLRVKAKLRGGSKGLFRSKQARLEAHIKGSDFERLDLLPGDIRLRDNDLLLGQHPKAKRVMKRLLRPLQRDYELLLVDCPPSIGRSMEPFLATADVILVPVVPTTLALRMLERTEAFCEELGIDAQRLVPFLTMVDGRKSLHREIRDELRAESPRLLRSEIHNSSQVERMGVQREPVGVFAPNSPGARGYAELWNELSAILRGRPMGQPNGERERREAHG